MRKGIYFIIICEKIDRNGIAVNPINCDVAEVDYSHFKKQIENDGWKIYCRSTLNSPELNLSDEVTLIQN